MSELSEAINEMRNMRESYDQIGAAAEAYNTGKTELAANLTAKGVPASASETLPELAEKVSAIAQESYTIDGGEMYAKQLFGSLETPNYWNLYEVLENLLSDGRLVNYGGILLAEYYKGYDSLALSGAGAGGAYVVSDKDSQGNFIMYTSDTTHTWDTAFDGKGNRWVAYCFADEYHDFQITDTNTSPRSIFIGRKVGTITCLVATRTSQVVVLDGSKLRRYNCNTKEQNFPPSITLRNLDYIEGTYLKGGAHYSDIYIEGGYNGGYTGEDYRILRAPSSCTVGSVIIVCNNTIGSSVSSIGIQLVNMNSLTVKAESISLLYGLLLSCSANEINLIGLEYFAGSLLYSGASTNRVYIAYKDGDDGNDKNRLVSLNVDGYSGATDIELKNGWHKPLNIKKFNSLTKQNVQSHIFDRLGVNDLSTGAVTITLATAVLNLFTQEEIDAVVARTNITIVGA